LGNFLARNLSNSSADVHYLSWAHTSNFLNPKKFFLMRSAKCQWTFKSDPSTLRSPSLIFFHKLNDCYCCFFFFLPTHDLGSSIFWSIKEDGQAPAVIYLVLPWHYFHPRLEGIRTHDLPWVEYCTARPQLSLVFWQYHRSELIFHKLMNIVVAVVGIFSTWTNFSLMLLLLLLL